MNNGVGMMKNWLCAAAFSESAAAFSESAATFLGGRSGFRGGRGSVLEGRTRDEAVAHHLFRLHARFGVVGEIRHFEVQVLVHEVGGSGLLLCAAPVDDGRHRFRACRSHVARTCHVAHRPGPPATCPAAGGAAACREGGRKAQQPAFWCTKCRATWHIDANRVTFAASMQQPHAPLPCGPQGQHTRFQPKNQHTLTT